MTKSFASQARGILILLIVFACLLTLFFASTLVEMYTDYLWFQSLNYTEIFTTRLGAWLELTVIAALGAVLLLIVNWSLIPHAVAPLTEWRLRPSKGATLPTAQEVIVSASPLRTAFTLAAVILGLVFGSYLGGHWSECLRAANGLPFGMNDPIFNQDVGFYVFQLPWYKTLLNWGISLVAVVFVGTLLRYSVSKRTKMRGPTAHLSLLGALWLILLGVSRLLDQYALLQSELGVVFGAGYTDINARIPLYIVTGIIFFVAALILIVNAFTREWKLLLLAGVAWLTVTVLGPLYPVLIQQFQVVPNEFSVERPYIEHNIAFTRYAYNLDKIQVQPYTGTGTLDQAALQANADIIQNVRLWDYRPLQDTYGQLQAIRLYYEFNDVDVDRYVLGGRLQSVMLSVRELDIDKLDAQAQTWINRHLIYTHGYGLTASPVSEISPEGLPNLLVRDIPPTSTAPELQITQPAIYFGELTQDYVLVGTTENEFDYPQAQENGNVYTRYAGPDGVRIGGLLRRGLLALRFGNSYLLISQALDENSRILFHRTIQDRVTAIAPMLSYDDDPYPVIADGRIIWILDAYTWTADFPYSEPHNGINYLRNSVKATVDAYTGETRFYMVDPQDPIAATYARIFPTLFRPAAEMPAALREHWRYPEALFNYQSQLYATYHMQDPQVFYNREDLWDIPQELVESGNEPQVMEPYYVITRLPGSDGLEFMMIRPYVPREKQNMVAWLYADSDGSDYGQVGVFELSKERLTYGPMQIEGRINQDPLISQQISLWDQRGSQVLRGNLMVLPINNTFLYVEPLYLEAEAGKLPELKRVIVTYGDRVSMAPTLQEALLQALTGTPSVVTPEGPEPAPSGDLEELAQQAWEHYQAAQLCLQQNDWTCYGREQTALEEILRAMAGE